MTQTPIAAGAVISWRGTQTTIVTVHGTTADGYVRCTVSQLDALYRRAEREASIHPDDVWGEW